MIVIQYLFICLVFGTTFLAIKTGIGAGLPPLFFAFFRFFAASVLLLGYLMLKKESLPKSWKTYGYLFLAGVLMTAVPFAALFWAETRIDSGTAALMVATAPIFIGLIGKMTKWQWIGSGIGVFGIYLIFFTDFQSAGGFLSGIVPKASIMISELFFAIGLMISKRLMGSGMSSKMLNGLQMLFASIVLLALSVIFEDPSKVQMNWQGAASLFYLVVIASIIASNIYYRLVEKTNPLFPTTWTYVAPVIAIIVGALFLQEKLSLISGIGALFVLGGVVLVNALTLQGLIRRPQYRDKAAG
ncbi:EamA family transporter [Paenibacillus sediminis]|uniref:Drug/metabolite transporter (DMT)-like permease n=1 Tax=Paenibacillus sediminis TaxID=664909 RepID=A0ABS4H575_9BACL|nr:EamA family transporter [Paenibacillus sediminis]MBP1937240.1 drug/metabolite transporter (DMT)-like permease [Paenibacillus sediminis]